MKLYLLYRTESQEGNFGDCEQAPSTLCGIFTEEFEMVLAKKELEKTCYKQVHQFGNHQQTIETITVESNQIVNIVME